MSIVLIIPRQKNNFRDLGGNGLSPKLEIKHIPYKEAGVYILKNPPPLQGGCNLIFDYLGGEEFKIVH